MAKKISASVGKNGKNKSEDVKIVQELLNDFTKMCGFKKLDEDGLIGPKTLSAIAEFQKSAVGMSRPDSRIDPSGDSFAALGKGPKKAEAEIKKTEQAEKEKQEAAEAKKAKKEGKEETKKESKPQVKGDTKGVDKKILGVLEAVSAHFGKPIFVESAKPSSSANGKVLWETWQSDLDRGKGIRGLKDQLREQLDTLYNKHMKDQFLQIVSQNSRDFSRAASSGNSVNIKKNTSSDMVDALSTIFSCEKAGDVICLDSSGKSIPNKISEDMKKKWG